LVKNGFLVAGLLVLISGCGLAVGPAALIGSDDNGNGVRDSVDRYFVDDLKVLPAPLRRAAYELARAYEQVLRIELSDRRAVYRVGDQMSLATACLYSTARDHPGPIAPGLLSRAIENRTYNSTARVKRLRAFSKLQDGRVWVHPDDRGCSALSEFQLAQ